MIMPVQYRCQVVPFSANPTGPAPYITTKLVGLVKFDATNWLFRGLIGGYRGPNGQTSSARIPTFVLELKEEDRERQSPDWRFASRQSGDWRSREHPHHYYSSIWNLVPWENFHESHASGKISAPPDAIRIVWINLKPSGVGLRIG